MLSTGTLIYVWSRVPWLARGFYQYADNKSVSLKPTLRQYTSMTNRNQNATHLKPSGNRVVCSRTTAAGPVCLAKHA